MKIILYNFLHYQFLKNCIYRIYIVSLSAEDTVELKQKLYTRKKSCYNKMEDKYSVRLNSYKLQVYVEGGGSMCWALK